LNSCAAHKFTIGPRGLKINAASHINLKSTGFSHVFSVSRHYRNAGGENMPVLSPLLGHTHGRAFATISCE
jgi:hypothetical protein